MTEIGIPRAGDLAPYETVPIGFESRYTGENTLADTDLDDLDLVFSQDAQGYVTMKYSLWGCFHTTPEKWNDEIRAINRMQADLGPLSDAVRRIRAHIASLVPCDNGVPVTIDEILNAIGTGKLPEPAFHPGCWMSNGTRGTQPQQIESMRAIEAILTGYPGWAICRCAAGALPVCPGIYRTEFCMAWTTCRFYPLAKVDAGAHAAPFRVFHQAESG